MAMLDEIVYEKVGVEEAENDVIALEVMRNSTGSDLVLDGYAGPVSDSQSV